MDEKDNTHLNRKDIGGKRCPEINPVDHFEIYFTKDTSSSLYFIPVPFVRLDKSPNYKTSFSGSQAQRNGPFYFPFSREPRVDYLLLRRKINKRNPQTPKAPVKKRKEN